MEEIIKNQPILNKLLNNIKNGGKITQSYLLSGNDKKKLEDVSILLSKVLLCENKYESNCTKCNICRQIDSGNYNELIKIKPVNDTIKISTIRQPIELIAEKAVNSLIDIINNKNTEKEIILPITYINGSTTKR